MAGTITKGYEFGSTELVTNAKLHTLVDSATISGIVDTELEQITTSDKVAWSALLPLVFWENTLVSYENELVYY